MALFDEDSRGYIIGAVAALAAAAVVREVRLGFSDLGRPIAKATIKSAIALMDGGRELFAHLSEVIEDLAVEARMELDAKRTAQLPPENNAPVGRTSNREVH